jgi:hypothetical protein
MLCFEVCVPVCVRVSCRRWVEFPPVEWRMGVPTQVVAMMDQ